MRFASIRPVAAILPAGLNAAAALSWGLLCLSTKFSFDIRPWSLWAVLGGPLAIAVVAVLARLVARTWPHGHAAMATGRVS